MSKNVTRIEMRLFNFSATEMETYICNACRVKQIWLSSPAIKLSDFCLCHLEKLTIFLLMHGKPFRYISPKIWLMNFEETLKFFLNKSFKFFFFKFSITLTPLDKSLANLEIKNTYLKFACSWSLVTCKIVTGWRTVFSSLATECQKDRNPFFLWHF